MAETSRDVLAELLQRMTDGDAITAEAMHWLGFPPDRIRAIIAEHDADHDHA